MRKLPAEAKSIEAFTFGDPEPVLDRRELLDCLEVHHNNRWYEPPVSMTSLTRAFDIPGPHASCIRLKVNLLAKHFVPSRWLSQTEFRKFALDFLVTGNGYLEQIDNMAGRPMTLRSSLARFTRRGIEPGRYFFAPGHLQEHEFRQDRIIHLMLEHPAQEIYGVPEYMGAMQAALLGEAATLFRRRYYLNGSHAGYIFAAFGASISNKDADAIRKAMRDSKGPGNFRNLFLHAPAGKKDDIQIIPVSEIAAKDEFFNVKTVSRDEMLAAHRTPPQLLGVVPANSGGFGDVSKANDIYFNNEIEPIGQRMTEVNDRVGVPAIEFRPYEPTATAPAPAGRGTHSLM